MSRKAPAKQASGRCIVSGKDNVVIITGTLHDAGLTVLRQAGVRLQIYEGDAPIPVALLNNWLCDADALIATSAVKVGPSLLSMAPRLRVIAQPAVGYDNIDVAACHRAGVPFCNTPGVLVEATADLAFALILITMRSLGQAMDHVRSGAWFRGEGLPYARDLAGKTLGIVGMGEIGTAVARRALCSGMQIVYHNRRPRLADPLIPADHLSMDDLLARADCVLIMAPLTDATRGGFGVAEFAAMKSGAFFVNAARGAIVQTSALLEAIASGHLAGAALDVCDPEPIAPDHPLLSYPNVVVTPHIGSATEETRARMAELTAQNIVRGLAGEPLLTPVLS